MDFKSFCILEGLLAEGEMNQRDVMHRIWNLDEPNRDSREEPWAFYYHITKRFKPLSQSTKSRGPLIENLYDDDDERKVWSITPEGARAFLKTLNEGEILSDPLYSKHKERLLQLSEIAQDLR